jgi:hypothetical protein
VQAASDAKGYGTGLARMMGNMMMAGGFGGANMAAAMAGAQAHAQAGTFNAGGGFNTNVHMNQFSTTTTSTATAGNMDFGVSKPPPPPSYGGAAPAYPMGFSMNRGEVSMSTRTLPTLIC